MVKVRIHLLWQLVMSFVHVFVFFRDELDQLRARIQTLEERTEPAQAEFSTLLPEDNEDTQAGAGLEAGEERDAGSTEGKGGDDLDTDTREREKASLVIQRNWREHRKRVGSRRGLCIKSKKVN